MVVLSLSKVSWWSGAEAQTCCRLSQLHSWSYRNWFSILTFCSYSCEGGWGWGEGNVLNNFVLSFAGLRAFSIGPCPTDETRIYLPLMDGSNLKEKYYFFMNYYNYNLSTAMCPILKIEKSTKSLHPTGGVVWQGLLGISAFTGAMIRIRESVLGGLYNHSTLLQRVARIHEPTAVRIRSREIGYCWSLTIWFNIAPFYNQSRLAWKIRLEKLVFF